MDKLIGFYSGTSRVYFRNSKGMKDFLGLKYGTNGVYKLEYMYELPKSQDIERNSPNKEEDDDWWTKIQTYSLNNAASTPLFANDRNGLPAVGNETASSPGADTELLERLSSEELKNMLNNMFDGSKTNISPSGLDTDEDSKTFKT